MIYELLRQVWLVAIILDEADTSIVAENSSA